MNTIQPGDFIKINEPHRMATYSKAHVTGIRSNGTLNIAYGSMVEDRFYWLYMGGGQTITQEYVSEVWRKINNKWTKVQ